MFPLVSVLGGGEHAEDRVGSVVIILDAPVGDAGLRFEQRVAPAGAVGLDPAVLPRGAGLDVAGAASAALAPVVQSVGGEIGSLTQRMKIGHWRHADAVWGILEAGTGDIWPCSHGA